jgi:hypothetical protein
MAESNYWLVTVSGFNLYANNRCFQTVPLKLAKSKTPVDWFAGCHECYDRTDFRPSVLIGFWSITREQYEKIRNPYEKIRNP